METAERSSQYQKVKEITDRLEAGIKDLFDSERYKSWLSTMGRFHNYSLNNTLLIHMQKPDASLVASYLSWQRNFGRQVNKGERAIRILAPTPYKKTIKTERLDPVTGRPLLNPDGSLATDLKEVLMPAFKLVNVFDVSQTEGKELPTLGVDELTGDVEGFGDFLEALKATCPVPIGFENIKSGAKGYFHTVENRIAIQKDMSQIQTIKTLIHEMAHQKLHSAVPDAEHEPEEKLTRSRKEVEAESVAFTVASRYGIDTSDYSFGYIAGWSGGKETKELKESLSRIRQAADEMITAIDEQLELIEKERHPERPRMPSALQELRDRKAETLESDPDTRPEQEQRRKETVR